MATTITIPDGYTVNMLPNGKFEIVQTQQPQQIYQQPQEYYQKPFQQNINEQNKKKIKFSREERQLLEFCHKTNMIEFLRENVEKHPLIWDEERGPYIEGW